jgi:hypothetical protein
VLRENLIDKPSTRVAVFFLLILAVAIVGPVCGPVSAQGPPARPMLINGNVTLNGTPAPDGLTLTAQINGRLAESTTTQGGQYTLVVNATDGDQTQGETVNFSLANLATSQTTTFDNISNGGVQALDLAFTGTPSQSQATATTTQTSESVSSTSTSSSSTEVPEFSNMALILLAIAALAVTLARRRAKRAGK